MLIPPLLLACALAAPPPTSFPTDTLVDVGGHRLRVEVIRGHRPLAFVLESGGGAELAWASVPESIAARTGATVVTYDRAGFGGSELGPLDLSTRPAGRGPARGARRARGSPAAHHRRPFLRWADGDAPRRTASRRGRGGPSGRPDELALRGGDGRFHPHHRSPDPRSRDRYRARAGPTDPQVR